MQPCIWHRLVHLYPGMRRVTQSVKHWWYGQAAATFRACALADVALTVIATRSAVQINMIANANFMSSLRLTSLNDTRPSPTGTGGLPNR